MTQNQIVKTSGKSGTKRGLLFLFSIGLFSLISISGIYAQNKTGDNGNGQSKPTTKTDSLKFQNRTENTGIWNPSGENIFYSGGRVGIGTDSPARILHMVDEMAMLRVDRNHPSGHDPALLLVNKLTTGEVQRSWMLTGGKNGFSIADYGNKTGGSNFTKVFQITPERLTVLGNVSTPTEKMEVEGRVKSDGSILRAGDGGSMKMEFNNSSSKFRFSYADSLGNGTNVMFLEKDGDVEVIKNLKVKAVLATALNGNGDNIKVGGTKLSTLLSGGGTGSSVWNSATNGQISYAGGDIRVTGGGVIAEKVVATVDPATFIWPDYVFAVDYNLPSLESVENHIKKEGHLPGVPSAKQINEEGIDMAKMNAVSMEKIEQLMLYTIEQSKQLQQQNAEIAKLKERLEKLEANPSNH